MTKCREEVSMKKVESIEAHFSFQERNGSQPLQWSQRKVRDRLEHRGAHKENEFP